MPDFAAFRKLEEDAFLLALCLIRYYNKKAGLFFQLR